MEYLQLNFKLCKKETRGLIVKGLSGSSIKVGKAIPTFHLSGVAAMQLCRHNRDGDSHVDSHPECQESKI